MKKRFQLIALLAVALLGACSGGKDKVAVEQGDESEAGGCKSTSGRADS